MLLDRLLERDKQPAIAYGKVVLIDSYNKRVKISSTGYGESWASFMPEEFPSLQKDDPVAIGINAGGFFLVRRLSVVIPDTTTVLII